MAGYVTNIESRTLENENFREVLFTSKGIQLVLMTIGPGDEIGLETHDDVDQFIRIEAGHGRAILDGREHALEDGSSVVIPAGTEHNIVNVSKSEHPDGTVHRTKAEADAHEREHHHHE